MYCLRECAAEHRTSSWLRARVAKGLPAAPLRQFRRANSREIAEFQDRTLPLAFSAGFSRVGRPNLAYGYTFLAHQEPKKSCVGKKDFAFFLRLGCDLLIVFMKNE